ncbi:MAG TPA: glycine--tRNA ligase subunit beta [Desulfitobacteriaceae bacterium]|nr:glycine--tRNA ligase subunit beta [Desulfitobacteriaceae bacterium]
MAKEFLLEIGTEEIPAKFTPGALKELEEQTKLLLGELRLKFSGLAVYGTPRRLTVLVSGLVDKQEDLNTEIKGPAVKAAYDSQGAPTKAALGFAKGQGVKVEDLFVQEVKGVPCVYARKSEAGKAALSLLPQLCIDLISSLHFPKPMRWGSLDFRFARPIRWLLALYGQDVIPFKFVGLESGRISYGHRTLTSEPVYLENAGEYVESLRRAYVLVDPAERSKRIWEQIQELAGEINGQVFEDQDLLSEITHLVEYPTALLGEIAPKYMHLPEPVLTTPMREHQRYFPVHQSKGKLLPYFITVRNGDTTALEKVKAGNEKVLKARLEDADFYYREDRKVKLADLVPKLEKIVYHEKLGTVRQRVERMVELAGFIGRLLELAPEQAETIKRTAFLAKADLVTLMVYDFPELQGIMGADYAASSGESPDVCRGIVEHYLPRFAGDDLPGSIAGKVVSIAEKIDAIVGTFGIGIQPTGSQDPYALRRQAQGVVSILLEAKWDFSINSLITEAYQLYNSQGTNLKSLENLLPILQDFFAQRLRFVLQEQGFRYDNIDAVLAHGNEFLYLCAKKVRILADKRTEQRFTVYLQAYIRCNNLTKKGFPQDLDPQVLADETEITLAKEISVRKEPYLNYLNKGDYEQAFEQAFELVPFIEILFQKVMIMTEDESLKNARLALLKQCVEILGCLGDLSFLV